MNVDSVQVSWDKEVRKWLVRIRVGEEVIRRYSEQPSDIDHVTLQIEAADLAAEEGYTVDRSNVTVIPSATS